MTFSCSKDLKDFIEDFSVRMGISRSEYINRHLIAGIKNDVEKIRGKSGRSPLLESDHQDFDAWLERQFLEAP